MRHLLNKSTITMIHLVEQELNITERDPNYSNPYKNRWARSGYEHEKEYNENIIKKKPVKKEKRKKGPQITKIELWVTEKVLQTGS